MKYEPTISHIVYGYPIWWEIEHQSWNYTVSTEHHPLNRGDIATAIYSLPRPEPLNRDTMFFSSRHVLKYNPHSGHSTAHCVSKNNCFKRGVG